MQLKNSLEDIQKSPSSHMHAPNDPTADNYVPKVNANDLQTETKPIEIEQRRIPDFPSDPEIFQTSNLKKEELIQLRNFLPSIAEKTISSRYENPLTQLKMSTKRWKILTFFLAIFSFTYFSLNLWATLTLTNTEILPETFQQVSNIVIQMQDMQFYSFTMNIVMDIWALAIYSILFIMLLRESSTRIETMMNEKGLFERVMIRLLTLVVVLFGLSYIIGTIFVICKTHSRVHAGELASLIVFHSSKMIYLLLNVIALRKYKSKKFTYEDLLLEALGPSDSGDERSETEENQHNFTNQGIPSISVV